MRVVSERMTRLWTSKQLDTRPRQALGHTYWLIAFSFPHLGFKLPQRSFSCAGAFRQLFAPGTTPKHLGLYHACSLFHALKHQLGVHDNLLDTWNEKAITKGHLYFRARGDWQKCYAVCPSLHSSQTLSRADTSLYIMPGFLPLFYLSTSNL